MTMHHLKGFDLKRKQHQVGGVDERYVACGLCVDSVSGSAQCQFLNLIGAVLVVMARVPVRQGS